jgi:phage-related protein (TIGR01555 family)
VTDGERRRPGAAELVQQSARLEKEGRVARTDAGVFVPSGTQMGARDPLAKQRPLGVPEWLHDPVSQTALYEGVFICGHVADIMSEDMLKSGVSVAFEDDEENPYLKTLSRTVQLYMENLGYKDYLQTSLCHEIVYGVGLAAIGVVQRKGKPDPAKPLEIENVKEIRYIEPIPRDARFSDVILDTNEESLTYGKPQAFTIKRLSGEEVNLDASRALFFLTRPRVGSRMGMSFYCRFWTVAQLIENTIWSLGQTAFNMATRKVTSRFLTDNLSERLSWMDEIEAKFNSLSVVVLDQDEKMETGSNSPGDLGWFVDWVWDVLGAATRINRSRLIGAQSGELASAMSDLRRYYDYINARQEAYLRQPLRRLVQMVLATDTLRAEKGWREDLRFRLVFNPAETLTRLEQEDLEVKRTQAMQQRGQALLSISTALLNFVDVGVKDDMIQKLLGGDLTSLPLMEDLFLEAPTEG